MNKELHTTKLLHEVMQDAANYLAENMEIPEVKEMFSSMDDERNDNELDVKSVMCDKNLLLYYKQININYHSEKYLKWLSTGFLVMTFVKADELEDVYNNLADEKSKDTFDWFLKFNIIMGLINIKVATQIYPYPIRSNKYYEILKHKMLRRIGNGRLIVNGCLLESEIELVEATWIYRQYYLEDICVPRQGDVIIDAGAFKGETAVWYAKLVGTQGKVFSFEPLLENIPTFKKNIKENECNNIVQIVHKGLGKGNQKMNIISQNYSSRCTDRDNGEIIEVITLDSFVHEMNLNRINIIKMDIEGSELDALIGAKETIRRFKPNLAICVYHKPEDIIEIFKIIKQYVPEYKIYISHKYEGWSETILFAVI